MQNDNMIAALEKAQAANAEMHIDSVVGSWVEWICNDSLGLGQTPAEFVSCAEELISRLEAHVDAHKRSA